MDSTVAVGTAAGDVDLADESGQPLTAQFGGGSGFPLVFVVVLAADAKDSATTIYRRPGGDESVDHRVHPFGRGLSSPRNVAACRTLASSVSSSRMRRRAARNSGDSLDGTPGRSPRSMSSCLIHLDKVTVDPFRQRDRVDAEIVRGLLLRLAGPHESDRASTELGRIGAGHNCQPFVEARQLVTESGTQTVGQVKMSPIRAADPTGTSVTVLITASRWRPPRHNGQAVPPAVIEQGAERQRDTAVDGGVSDRHH